jgi:hypothetical protein
MEKIRIETVLVFLIIMVFMGLVWRERLADTPQVRELKIEARGGDGRDMTRHPSHDS